MGAQKSATEGAANKEAVILDRYESGASDSWQWIATLTISSNGHRVAADAKLTSSADLKLTRAGSWRRQAPA